MVQHQPKEVEANRSFDTAENTSSDDDSKIGKAASPPAAVSPQLQLAFVANKDPNGSGMMTGSLVLVSDPSMLTSPFGVSNNNIASGDGKSRAGATATPPSASPIPMMVPITGSTAFQQEPQQFTDEDSQQKDPNTIRRRRQSNINETESSKLPQASNPLSSGIPSSFVLQNIPILFNSLTSSNTSTGRPQQQQKQNDGIPPITTSSSSLISKNIRPGSDSNDTGIRTAHYTVVSRDTIPSDGGRDGRTSSNGTEKTNLKQAAKKTAADLRNVIRDSTRTEIVNYEQIERIKIMHERFADGCKFSFNYNVLLLTASIIAGLGLVSNSTTTVIASMLVSPIMGPVVGMAYGATIHDYRLLRKAIKTETISIIFCIVIGVLIGVCTGPTELSKDWPTDEMYTRGTWQNFFVALPVALFSGFAVAVGLLDDQVSSLVGVAISASLLPPAVNAGILFVAYFWAETDWWNDDERPIGVQPELYAADRFSSIDVINVVQDTPIGEPVYSDQADFRAAGVCSISLTVANIVIVAIASMIMFRLKERLPISKKVFWTDLGVARKIYRDLAVMSNDDDSEVSSQMIDGNDDPSSSFSTPPRRSSSSIAKTKKHCNDTPGSKTGNPSNSYESIPEGNEA